MRCLVIKQCHVFLWKLHLAVVYTFRMLKFCFFHYFLLTLSILFRIQQAAFGLLIVLCNVSCVKHEDGWVDDMSIPVKCLLVLVSCAVFNTRLRQIRLGLLLDTYKKVDRANLQFLVLLVTSSPSTAEFVVAGLIPSCATVFLGGSMIKRYPPPFHPVKVNVQWSWCGR